MLEDAAGIRRVVLACGTVDLRKGIDGLATIIGDRYGQNPFEKGTSAQSNNDYRLLATSTCVNKGTEDIEGVTLPETDMDYTARIKDCTIDIGAYERSNQDNVQPDAAGYYYVTPSGAGNACGDSPTNAACAMKLQEVLGILPSQ